MTAKKRKWNGGGKLFFLLFTDAKTSREGRREKQTNKQNKEQTTKSKADNQREKGSGSVCAFPFESKCLKVNFTGFTPYLCF